MTGWGWPSSLSKPTSVWTSTSSNELRLNELMPGLYKIKIFYHYFSRKFENNYDAFGWNPYVKCGYFSKEYGDNEIPEFPSLGFSIPLSSVSTMSNVFNEIENLDLVFTYEFNDADGIKRYKYTTGNFELDKTTDPNTLIIKKKNNVKTLKEYLQTIDWGDANSKVNTSNIMRFSFGDLLKTMYILVNEHGVKVINESDLSNYETIKNQSEGMNENSIGQIELPYTYLDRYLIRTNGGYPNILQYNNLTRIKGITNNLEYFNEKFEYYSMPSNEWDDPARTYPYGTSYTEQSPGYFVKSGYERNFKYLRNNYLLGEVTSYLWARDQVLQIPTTNVCSFTGNIINSSLNGRRINHKIKWAIYEESEPGNEGFSSTSTLYCSGTIDGSSSGYFNFNGLLINERIKLDLSEYDLEIIYPSTIKMINGNTTENVEIPYEMYRITVEYRDNKNSDDINLVTMPTSGFTLSRYQEDGYDQDYAFGSGNTASMYLKSGKYINIAFRDTSSNILYEYNELILDKDLKFTFRKNCEISRTTVNLGSNEYKLYIYDEQENLYLKKIPTDANGIIGPLILMNIKYTFKKVDLNDNIISSITKKLNLEVETIDLSE